MKKSQHVVPHNNTWAVRKSGSSKVTKTFKTQTSAIKFAKSIAKTQRTELLIPDKGKFGLKTAMETTRVHRKTQNINHHNSV